MRFTEKLIIAAKAVAEYAGNVTDNVQVEGVEEISGHGLKGKIDGKDVLAGSLKLMKKFNIDYPKDCLAKYHLGNGGKNYCTDIRCRWHSNPMVSSDCRCWRSLISHIKCGTHPEDKSVVLLSCIHFFKNSAVVYEELSNCYSNCCRTSIPYQ